MGGLWHCYTYINSFFPWKLMTSLITMIHNLITHSDNHPCFDFQMVVGWWRLVQIWWWPSHVPIAALPKFHVQRHETCPNNLRAIWRSTSELGKRLLVYHVRIWRSSHGGYPMAGLFWMKKIYCNGWSLMILFFFPRFWRTTMYE